MNLKSLAKDTALYGLSSIVGRFLNYLLVPVYTYHIPAESGGYGIVSNLYAYTALFLALLTFGMETTLFRFSNKDGVDSDRVYGVALKMVGFVCATFVILLMAFLKPLAGAMGYDAHPEYVGCMGIIVAFDAFQAIMFSRLRQQRRPVKFVALKFAFIIPDVLLTLFIFLVMPKLFGHYPALENLFKNYDYGVGLIFFTNLVCTSLVFLGFHKELKGLSCRFDRTLCREMLKYSWPLLLFSLVGILNQVADKILFPPLMPGPEGMVQLGIYGACVKIAMIMSLLVQSFRYAYEPIVFNGSRGVDNPQTLATGTKYFVIFAVFAFLAVVFYLPVLKHIIDPSYWEGLDVVPIVMLAELFMGIYFNLSFWYKLTDQTWWGAIMSAVGAAVMILINVLFIPKIGYLACAWGGFAGYGVSMLMSFFIGRRKYPIDYDFKRIGLFVMLAASIWMVDFFLFQEVFGMTAGLRLVLDTAMLLIYALLMFKEVKSEKI